MNEANRPLTLQEAADQIGTSRSRLWRAMSDGNLNVEKRRVAGRSVWTVLEVDLVRWAEEFLSEARETSEADSADVHEHEPEHSRTFANTRGQSFERSRTSTNDREQSSEHPRTTVNVREQQRMNTSEQTSEHPPQPPVELYLALVDRVQRAERRTVELELTLQQSQRLLCENAESITEREAQVKQVAAEAELHKQRENDLATENARLAAELEATRHQLLEAQKPHGLLSWLGLRKRRTNPQSADQAV